MRVVFDASFLTRLIKFSKVVLLYQEDLALSLVRISFSEHQTNVVEVLVKPSIFDLPSLSQKWHNADEMTSTGSIVPLVR
jgi:hypothetical protein